MTIDDPEADTDTGAGDGAGDGDARLAGRVATGPAVEAGAITGQRELGPLGAFDGAPAFGRVLAQALQQAVAESARRLSWCDADFSQWPLGDPAFLDPLTRWARGGARELVMIAGDYRAIERFHPRFVNWRRDWSHVMRCLQPDESRTAAVPTLWLADPGPAIRVFDIAHWRGRAGFDRTDTQRAREDFEAIAQRATAAFGASTLGL